MDRRPAEAALQSSALAGTPTSALIAAFVPGLANTVLFQLVRPPLGALRTLWLHAIYREGDVTFDATARLEGSGEGSLQCELQRFARSEECVARIVAPLAVRVRAHFGR